MPTTPVTHGPARVKNVVYFEIHKIFTKKCPPLLQLLTWADGCKREIRHFTACYRLPGNHWTIRWQLDPKWQQKGKRLLSAPTRINNYSVFPRDILGKSRHNEEIARPISGESKFGILSGVFSCQFPLFCASLATCILTFGTFRSTRQRGFHKTEWATRFYGIFSTSSWLPTFPCITTTILNTLLLEHHEPGSRQ